MKKELKYMILEYDNIENIEEIASILNKRSEEIVSYLEIRDFKPKINIRIYDNLLDFKKEYIDGNPYYKSVDELPDWLCGFAVDYNVYTVTLKELNKLEKHKNDDLNDFITLILHEFVHSCHHMINNDSLSWVLEGAATNLSGQISYREKNHIINASLDDIKNKKCDYNNYYLMFKYLLDNYDKEYVLEVLKDIKIQESITEEIYNKTVSMYNKNIEKTK